MKQVNRANSPMARLFSEAGMPLGSFLFVMGLFPLSVLRLKEIRQQYLLEASIPCGVVRLRRMTFQRWKRTKKAPGGNSTRPYG